MGRLKVNHKVFVAGATQALLLGACSLLFLSSRTTAFTENGELSAVRCPNDCSSRGECVGESCVCEVGFGGKETGRKLLGMEEQQPILSKGTNDFARRARKMGPDGIVRGPERSLFQYMTAGVDSLKPKGDDVDGEASDHWLLEKDDEHWNQDHWSSGSFDDAGDDDEDAGDDTDNVEDDSGSGDESEDESTEEEADDEDESSDADYEAAEEDGGSSENYDDEKTFTGVNEDDSNDYASDDDEETEDDSESGGQGRKNGKDGERNHLGTLLQPQPPTQAPAPAPSALTAPAPSTTNSLTETRGVNLTNPPVALVQPNKYSFVGGDKRGYTYAFSKTDYAYCLFSCPRFNIDAMFDTDDNGVEYATRVNFRHPCLQFHVTPTTGVRNARGVFGSCITQFASLYQKRLYRWNRVQLNRGERDLTFSVSNEFTVTISMILPDLPNYRGPPGGHLIISNATIQDPDACGGMIGETFNRVIKTRVPDALGRFNPNDFISSDIGRADCPTTKYKRGTC